MNLSLKFKKKKFNHYSGVVVNTESEIEKDFIEKLADSDEENGMKGDPPKEISTDEEEHQFNETE